MTKTQPYLGILLESIPGEKAPYYRKVAGYGFHSFWVNVAKGSYGGGSLKRRISSFGARGRGIYLFCIRIFSYFAKLVVKTCKIA